MKRLQFENVSKRYGQHQALQDVSLCLNAGEAHALMGENGAGKSTLIRLMAGVERADSMIVRIDDHPVDVITPSDAQRAGFRFIHQEHHSVPQISVAENILLGQNLPIRAGVAIDWTATKKRAQLALSQLGIEHIDVSLKAGKLSPGDLMLAKIAGALSSAGNDTACLYVLDEPTAALTIAESDKLFNVLQKLKQAGAAILYVSHRLNEVMQVCERISVLRDGRNVIDSPTSETDKRTLIRAMTGRDASDAYPPRISSLSTDSICVARNIRSQRLTDINFSLRKGEVMGVAGLAGAGQSELLKLFMGLEKTLAGDLSLAGMDSPDSPAQAWSQGVAYIPRERRTQALMPGRSICDNTVLAVLTQFGVLAKRAAELARTQPLAQDVSLKFTDLWQTVGKLSGGNQQKVVFARALTAEPSLLLLDEPTRGVDVAAKFDIYSLVRDLSASGCAVLLSSSDLPELLGMCDRILILNDGKQSEIVTTDEIDQATLLNKFHDTVSVGLST